MPDETKTVPRIVYLVGAGATQAEIDHQGGVGLNLLMGDVKKLGDGLATRIIGKAEKYHRLNDKSIADNPTDVEKLISLLDNTGLNVHKEAAHELRRLYFHEILDGLTKAEVLNEPELAILVLRMHNDSTFKENVEQLAGIISLNHDWLYQIASNRVFGGIHLGFDFRSTSFKQAEEAPLIIKPHGSFNWRSGLPIKVNALDSNTPLYKDTLWIPPTILKESRGYPYNKLAGLAHELLAMRCDVLRIVGCRLSQNDWNIVSLLFNAQYYQGINKNPRFRVELIMSPDSGKEITKEYSYLQNIFSIENLTDGDFSQYKEDGWKKQSALANAFKFWLRTKINFHNSRAEFTRTDLWPSWVN